MNDIMIRTILLIIFVIYTIPLSKSALHMLQQNRYEIIRFRHWQKENVVKTYPLNNFIVWFVVIIGYLKYIIFGFNFSFDIFMIIVLLIGIFFNFKKKTKKQIKPLVITNRVKRQIFTLVFLYVIMIINAYLNINNILVSVLILFVFNFYQMHFISLAALINTPLENSFKLAFMKKAQDKLNTHPNLIKIGITGSYGKTSSKNIINEILSKKYYTLPTPASFNTPLGISITLNNDLTNLHEVFICEMGADKLGEITELMDFVSPEVGVVTSIGNQHILTFKSQENIIHEKMQMVECLKEDGLAILNIDEKYIREYPIKNKCKQLWYGIDNKADLQAINIDYNQDGSHFDVLYQDKSYHFETKLLGKHNIYNILAAIGIGLHYNISMEELIISVKKLNYIKNRLELKKQDDYTIIDNAFNSNPISSKLTLDVLARMPNLRICITPGFIDLGKEKEKYHLEFGRYFKDRCDIVILVGRKQTKDIYRGLEESQFKMKNVYVVNTIYDAYNLLYQVKEKDCFVLFENDLPDAFNN